LSSFEARVIAIPGSLADPILDYCGISNNAAAEAGLSMKSEP
jgi:hypothetical protein